MAKTTEKIARRYAKALAGLYKVNELEDVKTALQTLLNIWESNPEFRVALSNPALNLNQRCAALLSVVERLRPSDTNFSNFFKVLIERQRLQSLPQVFQAFSQIIDELRNLLSLQITSAFSLDNAETAEFQQHIEKEFGSIASVKWSVNPELIGGMRVKAGDKLLDSSIRGALEKMQAALLA